MKIKQTEFGRWWMMVILAIAMTLVEDGLKGVGLGNF